MEKKHINRKKSYVPDDIIDSRFSEKADNDTWSRFQPTIGEKIISEEIFQVPDRAITFNRNKVEKIENNYNNETKDFKDKFSNTAQYLKFLNAHLAEKRNYLDKIVSKQDRFEDSIASLNPEHTSKEQLDKMNYNKIKVSDVQKVLEQIQNERESIKEKIEHFSNQINQAKVELDNKDKQIDGIKSEIVLAQTLEQSSQSEIEKKENVTEAIQKELKSLVPNNESEKVLGAINSLVVLLNSKNQATLNELNSIKNEFKKMKQEYDKVMHDLEQKK